MTARDLARRALGRVEEGGYATLVLGSELEQSRLPANERALATELVYGVLKQRRRVDAALAAYAPRGLGSLDARVLDTLRLGAYQILFLRIPAYAAVDDAVQAVKRTRGAKLAGFVNAILRKLSREGEPPPKELGVEASAPDWLVALAQKLLGEEARAFLSALNTPAPLWLRANTLRISATELAAKLGSTRVEGDAVRADGLGDPSRAPGFGEGLFTVQDLAAQRVARLVEPQPGEKLLDACAGVGGKSTHLAALAGDRASIDAADLSERKLELGADTARRLGIKSLNFIRCDLTDARAPLAPLYDRILLDAPCTGLGVLRRHPEAKWRRQPSDAAELAELQRKLLEALAPRLKAGGLLVYSVCTFTDEEGPEQVRRFVASHPEFTAERELRTWPHRDDADAFFAVCLRRMR